MHRLVVRTPRDEYEDSRNIIEIAKQRNSNILERSIVSFHLEFVENLRSKFKPKVKRIEIVSVDEIVD